MRSAYVTVAILLLVGVVLFTAWPSMVATSPPGQFPINKTRWIWPMTERMAPYRPGRAMGSDAARVAGGQDLKAKCATDPVCRGL